jgi:ribosomal protein L37AE/L43A
VAWEPGKPSNNEDEYFARRDAEWIKARRAELDRQAEADANAAKGIKCPRCGNGLVEREFQNVKLDACTKCKGVWFDAGELELIMLLKRGDQLRVITGLAK